MSCYIVTLGEAKSELGIPDQKDDGDLTRLIETLQGRFELYCNRLFNRATKTAVFDGGKKKILLDLFPIESIASVYLDYDRLWTSDTLLDPDDDYFFEADRGRVNYANADWPEGIQVVRITWSGGYVAAGVARAGGQYAMPEGLRGAMMMQLGFEWRNRLNLGKGQVSAQGQGVNLAPARFLPAVLDALQPYVRV
jgi:hypothetical protein